MARIKLPNILDWLNVDEISDGPIRKDFHQYYHILRPTIREWCAGEFNYVPLIMFEATVELRGTFYRYHLDFENDYHAVLFKLRWM